MPTSSIYSLALETSTPICSVALYHNENCLASITAHSGPSHSRLLPVMIQQLLTLQKLKVSDLTAIAIGKGPGSYTGLRIGAAIAKGMAYSHHVPLIGLGTLEILAATYQANPPTDMICPLLDARNHRCYGLLIDLTSHQKLLVPQVLTMQLDTFLPWLEKGTITFLGSGADRHADLLLGHPNARLVQGHYPQASAVGSMITKQLKAKNFLDMATFSPQYLSEHWPNN